MNSTKGNYKPLVLRLPKEGKGCGLYTPSPTEGKICPPPPKRHLKCTELYCCICRSTFLWGEEEGFGFVGADEEFRIEIRATLSNGEMGEGVGVQEQN